MNARPESCLQCGSTNLAPAERLPESCWRCLQCRAVFRRNDDGPAFVATLLCLVMEQVHAGGKLSIVGSGPLSAPGQRGYDATLTSHTGARHAAAHGSSLGLCLEQLVLRWGKL